MPRSKYIYFVREVVSTRLLCSCTVKREANLWALLNKWDPVHAALSRVRDGVGEDEYPEIVIPWAEEEA